MSLNGCRQRLLFAHWLTQWKCSLCLQGMSWQVASINISANQNTGFVMEYQVHNPFNQHFWKFLFEVKWNGLFRFSPMEIFGISCEGRPLWLTGLVRLKFPVPFSQIVVSENCLSVSRSQYHWCGKQLILFWKRHLQYNHRRLSSYFLVNPLTFKCCLFACLSSLTKWVVWLQALYWWWECSLKSETCLRWCNQQAKKVKTCRWTLLCFMYCCHWWCHRWSINYWKIPLHSFMGIVEIPPGNFGWMDCIPSQSGRGKAIWKFEYFFLCFS